MARQQTTRQTRLSGEAFSTPRTSDEERDFSAFRDYLARLSPDALGDVAAHLDEARFPRRAEAVKREMERRRLFFLSPYTETELRLRTISTASVLFALLAAVLNGIPAGVGVMAGIAHSFGAANSNYIPGERVSFVPGLTLGEEKLLNALIPATRWAGALALGVVSCAALFSLWHLGRKKLRRDVCVTVWAAACIAGGLLWLAFA